MANDRGIYANQATVVGQLLKMEIKSFDRKKPKPGENPKFELLEAEIGAAGSKIRVTVMPTKKDPQKHQNLYKSFPAGTKVQARGAIQEQVNEQGKIFRGMQAFGLEIASDSETEKLVYYLAGHLGHPEKTGDGQVVVPVTVVNKYTNAAGEEQQREETVRIQPDDQTLATLYQKVSAGRIIQSRGHMLNKINFDEFGVPDGYQSALTVAKLEVRDEENAMWLVVSDTLPSSLPSGQAPPPARAAAQTPNFNDDDDVPF